MKTICQGVSPKPGRMMTSAPMKPTTTAVQRLGPTRSPSTGPENAVISTGPSMVMAAAVASGTHLIARKKHIDAVSRQAPRTTCATGRAVRSRRKPGPRTGVKTATMKRSAPA